MDKQERCIYNDNIKIWPMLTFKFYMHITLALVIASCASMMGSGQSRDQTMDILPGTWVFDPGKSHEHLVYIRADSLLPDTRGFVFHDNGVVIIQHELGCQIPYPHFIKSQGTWAARSPIKVVIDRKYPGEKPDMMRIKKLSENRIEFIWTR